MRGMRGGSNVSMILLAGVVYTYWSYIKYVVVVIILVLVARLIIKITQKLRTTTRNLYLQNVDLVNGVAFEHYIAQLLIDCGYTNVSLTEQYDYGIDIIAEKDGIRWGIQVKRYSGLVKAAAVRQVVTGLPLYGCDRAMVITNSTFSNVARRLADGNNCILVDRSCLSALTRLERKYI